jgi:hypothetical protein
VATPVEVAVDAYIRASGERDDATRRRLLEACFAADGRFVTRSTVLRGRAAVDAMLSRADVRAATGAGCGDHCAHAARLG